MYKIAGLAALATFPVLLWTQVISVNPDPTASPGLIQGPKTVDFALQADPPAALMRFRSASTFHSSSGVPGSEVVAHRYFYNEDDQTYFGYDVHLETAPRAGIARVTFYDLSIGVLDAVPFAVRGNPMAWKKLPPPPLPASREVQAGDTIRLGLWEDPAAGQKLTDLIRFDRNLPLRQPVAVIPPGTQPGLRRFPDVRPIPTVSGDAHPYSAEDAEMRLGQVRVTLNGELQASPGRSVMLSASLIWFHLPKRGRYVLSLAPRPELGFVQAGEVRGGSITFTLDNDKFLLESYTSFAPGAGPYFVYVLHDPEWQPIGTNQADGLQFGSVNPRELALLRKK